MNETHFLTRPMSVWLDLVRGIAAIAVVVGHADQFGIYTGPYPFSMSLQQNAVVVFFVLSGMVIATSVDRKPGSLSSYAIARAARIVPVTLAAIAVSLAVAAFDTSTGSGPKFVENNDWANLTTDVRAVLFLGESYASIFGPNKALWSLCYEVWFYALFGAATYMRGRTRQVALAAMALIAGPNILMLLPVWLIGVHIVRSPRAIGVPLTHARMSVAIALFAMFMIQITVGPLNKPVMAILPWEPHYSYRMLSDLLLAAAIAQGFIGLRTLSEHGFVLPASWKKPVRYLAGISFSIYLLHWPLLSLACILGVSAGSSPIAFAAIVAAIVAISAGFAAVTEHKSAAVRSFLENCFAGRARSASPA